MGLAGFIVIIPIAALAGWVIFAIFRWLRLGGYDRQWWKAFAMLMAVGLALGVWLTFFLEYTVANAHLHGFPIPVQIANREKPGEPWIISNMPMSIRAGGMVTDLLSGVALCLAPLALAAFFKENKGKLAEPTRAPNPPS